jgi:hypothetical protein
MKYFSEILEQFTTGQKVFVLILLLTFTSGTYIASIYFRNDNCKELVDENKALLDDFVKVSGMVRDLKMQSLSMVVQPEQGMPEASYSFSDTIFAIQASSSIINLEPTEEDIILDEILDIADSHRPK